MAEPLARPAKRQSYRRPTRDKPFRVVWREGGKDRSQAFGGPGQLAQDEARRRWLMGWSVLGVDVRSGYVYDYDLGHFKKRREPTNEERERILAMGFTYDPR
jgi:hypothetical protein